MTGKTTEGGLMFERLVFFSDAVFAIAITLLVLDLRLPPGAPALTDLSPIADKLFGFGLSFCVIGVFWLGHHRLFGGLKADDAAVRLVNLAFLGAIVFMPFPTSVIAEHQANSTSVRLYALSVGAAGLLLAVLALVARRPPLLAPGETFGATVRTMIYLLVSPTVFLSSAWVAGAQPRLAMQLWWSIIPGLILATVFGTWLGDVIDRRTAKALSAIPRNPANSANKDIDP